MTKGDKILILILVTASLLGMYLFLSKGTVSDRAYVSVQVDGREVKKLQFDKSMVGKTYRIDSIGGYNILELGDGKVRVLEADCKDQVDVHQGWISKPGETLVCLPHKLVIQIIDDSEPNDVDHINY